MNAGNRLARCLLAMRTLFVLFWRMAKGKKARPGRHLDGQEQLIAGIEIIALASYYIAKKSKAMNWTDLARFVNELLFPMDDVKALSDRQLQNYRSIVEDKYNLNANFAGGRVDGLDDLERMHRIASDYLRTFCRNYDDDALRKLLRYRKDTDPITFPETLFLIFFLRNAARFSLQIEMDFDKIMGKVVESRRVVPVAFVCRTGYLDLIAEDAKDKKIKQFMVSGIRRIKTDFVQAFRRRPSQKKPFDPEKYKNTKEFHFQQEPVKVEIEMRGQSFKHFLQTYLYEYEVIAKDAAVRLRITGSERDMLNLVFNYGPFCTVLGPATFLKAYEGRLNAVRQIQGWSQ